MMYIHAVEGIYTVKCQNESKKKIKIEINDVIPNVHEKNVSLYETLMHGK